MADFSSNFDFSKDFKMQQYFDTLPKFVQETLMQSGVQPNTLEELKSCAENLLGGHNS